jgi:hypothetical protein
MMSAEEQQLLYAELAPLNRIQTAVLLQAWRPIGIAIARAKTATARKAILKEFAGRKRLLALYSAAAWTVRTIALAEYMERSELVAMPRKWAADTALNLLDEFEGDENWLWPFESDPPWELDEEDED